MHFYFVSPSFIKLLNIFFHKSRINFFRSFRFVFSGLVSLGILSVSINIFFSLFLLFLLVYFKTFLLVLVCFKTLLKKYLLFYLFFQNIFLFLFYLFFQNIFFFFYFITRPKNSSHSIPEW